MKKPIEEMLYRYPQLSLCPQDGLSQTEKYRDIVRRGILPKFPENPFLMSDEDELIQKEIPGGSVEVLFLKNRIDFERTVRILAYKGENREIPISMGAVTVSGINNWRKIYSYLDEYLKGHGSDWDSEFVRLRRNKKSYQDTLIILSDGNYSGLSPEAAEKEAKIWLNLSREIRMYHEMSHVISRRIFPENRQKLRDELVADCIGLVAAMGDYDVKLARKFLGIEKEYYRNGGRLQNYMNENEDIHEAAEKAGCIIEELYGCCRHQKTTPFKLLIYIEENKIGF